MGGGPSKADQQQQRDIANQQLKIGQTLVDQGTEQLAQRKELQQPLIAKEKGILGGDYNKMLQSASIPISLAEKQAQQEKRSIQESAPTGPTKDFLLASASRDRISSLYDYVRAAYEQAPVNLANLGSESGQVGLQEFAGGERGIEGSASTRSNLMQIQAQARASMLNFIGGLAGTAGKLAGGLPMFGGNS